MIVLLSSLRHPSKDMLSPRMVVTSWIPHQVLNPVSILPLTPHFIVSYLANLNELRKNVLTGAAESTVTSPPR